MAAELLLRLMRDSALSNRFFVQRHLGVDGADNQNRCR